MVRVVRLSHADISETKRDRRTVTRKLEQKSWLPDSESAIRFVIGSMYPPFWVFPGWHFTHSDRIGPVGLVNVVNGSVGTVTSWQHTGHRGGPAIVTSHHGRYHVPSTQSNLAKAALNPFSPHNVGWGPSSSALFIGSPGFSIPKQDVDPFSRHCAARFCDRQTNRC